MWRLTGEGIDVKFVLDRAARLPCFRSRALSSCRCPPRSRSQAVHLNKVPWPSRRHGETIGHGAGQPTQQFSYGLPRSGTIPRYYA